VKFTDEDLKRLKELDLEELIQLLIRLNKCELKSDHPTDAAKRIWEFLMIDPLLERLEVAECVINHFRPYVPFKIEDCATFKAWCEISGQ
jgi:hypothetical protein